MASLPFKRILPAEWARQDGVLLTWPHEETDWASVLDEAEAAFCVIAAAIATRERLLIACRDAAHQRHIRHRLEKHGIALDRVRTAIAPADDTWARDHGPITVTENGRPVLLDFRFNGWGGKYPHARDDAITATLHHQGCFGAAAMETIDLVLEGGGIESDGAGTLLTTASCLLAPTRNPGYGKAELEARLRSLLGIERVLWLRNGHLEGDDTDGHIDTLARFCDGTTIAYQACSATDDPHYLALSAMAGELGALRQRDGNPYRLIPLPWPRPCFGEDGRRLPATYANFLIINDAVLLPVYDDPADEEAASRLQSCFPDRTIVPIDCRTLIRQNGSLHCVTMQLPAGLLAEPDE